MYSAVGVSLFKNLKNDTNPFWISFMAFNDWDKAKLKQSNEKLIGLKKIQKQFEQLHEAERVKKNKRRRTS